MLEDLLRLPTPKKKRDPSLLKWMKELMGASLEKHSDILEKSKDDLTFQKIRDKWRSEEEIEVQEKAIIKLMKKCNGKNKESTWLQLRPLLLHKIENDKVFQVWWNLKSSIKFIFLSFKNDFFSRHFARLLRLTITWSCFYVWKGC